MSLDAVYEIIATTRHSEHQAATYGDWLDCRLASLHPLVILPGPDQRASLDHFVIGYIEMAPRMLFWIRECAEQAGLAPLFAAFLETAIGYFTTPRLPQIQHTGIEGLLVKAYQAHRLIEEMLDQNRSLARRIDCLDEATHASLLVHTLIGEPFANELDQACELTMATIMDLPSLRSINFSQRQNASLPESLARLRDDWQALLEGNHIAFGIRAWISACDG